MHLAIATLTLALPLFAACRPTPVAAETAAGAAVMAVVKIDAAKP
jgi:hypothetical protein